MRWRGSTLVQAAAFVVCAAPAALLASRLPQRTRYDIVPFLLEHTGFWALTFLLITLSCSPLRTLTGWRWPRRWRRMLGLFTFFYASAHMVGYLAVGQKMHVNLMVEDMIERPFVALGLLSYLLLIPLAVTSNRRMVSRLGHVRWTRLHRLIYLLAVVGLVHAVLGADVDRQALINRFVWASAALLTVRVLLWGWQKARRAR